MATTYGTLAGFRAYHTERGEAAPTSASDADATAALVRGSDHVRLFYVMRMATAPDPVPDAFAEAAYEAGLLELNDAGFFSTTFTPHERKTLTQVDSIRWTPISGGTRGDEGAMPVSLKVEAILRPYIGASRYGVTGVVV